MTTLHLTLTKHWFLLILKLIKRTEYRSLKPQWISRLLNPDGSHKEYDVIKFVNGYGKHRPYMIVEFKGFCKAIDCPPTNGEEVFPSDFAIHLGEILETGNLELIKG